MDNLDGLDCVKCKENDICKCPKCLRFYKSSDKINSRGDLIHPSCLTSIINNGCRFKDDVSFISNDCLSDDSCTEYEEIDWIDKIKYRKKLRLFEEG